MTLRLPDGSIQQIRYTGNVPPQVVLAPMPAAAPPGFFGPVLFGPIGFGPSFAAVERMSAILDRQADAMMRQVAAMQSAVMEGGSDRLPPGLQVYSMSSTIGGNGVCMRSVEIIFLQWRREAADGLPHLRKLRSRTKRRPADRGERTASDAARFVQGSAYDRGKGIWRAPHTRDGTAGLLPALSRRTVKPPP